MSCTIIVVTIFLAIAPRQSQQECSSIEKCSWCSKKECGSDNCYHPNVLNLFGGKCSYSKRQGGWSTWSSWSQCTASCGYATKSRHRSCNNPSPAYHGNGCLGSSNDRSVCPENPFCFDCDISQGDRTYVPGILTNPQCVSKGQCFDKEELNGQQKCYYRKIHGGWSVWATWSDQCIPFCGGAWQKRHRECTQPAPKYTGNHCKGSHESFKACELNIMPGIAYKEKTTTIPDYDRREIIARSVSKLQCILKCKNKTGCANTVFRPISEGVHSIGTCYSLSTAEDNNDQGLMRNSRDEEVLMFEKQIAIPPGTSETANLRDFCRTKIQP